MATFQGTAVGWVSFGRFGVDLSTGDLRTSDGQTKRLQQQPLQVLRVLLEANGRAVTREELRLALWPEETFVDFEHGLNSAVRKLRQALEDSSDNPKYVETLPKVGYRFIAPMEWVPDPPDSVRKHRAPERAAGHTESSTAQPTRRWKLGLAVAALAICAGLLYPFVKSPIERQRRFTQLRRLTIVPLTALPGHVISPTFSPDGNQIAFGWDGEKGNFEYDLYLKTIGTDKPLRLTHNSARWLTAEWSPDGRAIAVSRPLQDNDSGIFLVPPTGGPERKLTSTLGVGLSTRDLSWSPDGKQIAFTDRPNESSGDRPLQLFTLSVDTLERTPVNTDCGLVVTPSYSPGGDMLAWSCVDSWSSFSIHSLRLKDGIRTKLLAGVDGIGGLGWSRDGRRIVYSAPLDFGDLWEVSLDHPGRAERLPFAHDASDLDLTVSRTSDRLAYVQGVANVNIWKVDLNNALPHSRALIISSRQQKAPSISPDQTKIALESNRSGSNELWVCDADGSNAMQLTSFGIRATGTPRWSPDGKLIAFDSRAEGEANIYLIDPNRGIPRKLNITNVRGNNLPSWSRDGKWIYFVNGEDAHRSSVWKVAPEGGEAIPIASSPATYPLEAPDGNYLYFYRNPKLWRSHVDGSGEEEVMGMPALKRLGDKWIPHGTGIYFLSNLPNKTALDFFDTSTKITRRITELDGTAPLWMGQLSISSDGAWLVYPQIEASSSNLMMIENWQ